MLTKSWFLAVIASESVFAGRSAENLFHRGRTDSSDDSRSGVSDSFKRWRLTENFKNWREKSSEGGSLAPAKGQIIIQNRSVVDPAVSEPENQGCLRCHTTPHN